MKTARKTGRQAGRPERDTNHLAMDKISSLPSQYLASTCRKPVMIMRTRGMSAVCATSKNNKIVDMNYCHGHYDVIIVMTYRIYICLHITACTPITRDNLQNKGKRWQQST
ncbi:TPA: hypothetical protein ACH3X2_002796 [Trebouxia sp. C0005]